MFATVSCIGAAVIDTTLDKTVDICFQRCGRRKNIPLSFACVTLTGFAPLPTYGHADSVQVDDQTQYAPFPVVLHQTRQRTVRPIKAVNELAPYEATNAGAGPACGECPPKPPVLRIGWRQLKHRAIGVTTFEYLSIALQELTVSIAER